jgi:cardiolipin synthase
MSDEFAWLAWLAPVVLACAAVAASLHALLTKRDPRSALGWIAVSVLFPAAGPALYYVFGINRIRTRAKRLHADDPDRVRHRLGPGAPPGLSAAGLHGPQPERVEEDGPLGDLRRLSRIVTGKPLTAGNEVELLRNGEEAYPAMLEAIRGATDSVYLATYIFESNETGKRFVEALAGAHRRGVRVRVLVDGVGELYSRPRISKLLRGAGVQVARFLPPRLFPPQFQINLRTHRKILVVDGAVAFTGGMNIGDRHLADSDDPDRVIDVHFRLRGPVAAQIESVFREDWEFVSEEQLSPSPAPEARGSTRARIVLDGPNEDLDQLSSILIGAVTAARRRVCIVTPYFLPPRDLTAAMKAAALRGVDVRVVLPEKNNLPYVHWASRNELAELLYWGVRVHYQPPPFAHTKLFIVDDTYVQFGSANLDPRSLRLNFELSVETFDPALVSRVDSYLDEILDAARLVSVEEIEARPLWERVRDASAWLFSPYL